MKSKKVLTLSLLSALTLGGLTIGTLASCGEPTIDYSATLNFTYNEEQGSVSATLKSDGSEVSEETILQKDDVVVIKATPVSGYEVASVNGVESNATEWEYTLVSGVNNIEVTFKKVEDDTPTPTEGPGFNLSVIIVNLENNPDGIRLMDRVTFDEGVTPFAIDLEYEENDIFDFDGEYIIPKKPGVVNNVVAFKASDKAANENNSRQITIMVTTNSTDLDLFNTAGAFESYDAITSYFDVSGSNRLSDMTFGRGADPTFSDETGPYVNLWVSDNYESADELPVFNLKSTLTSGISANTTYTISFKLNFGGFNNIQLKVNGEVISPNKAYGGMYDTYYHVFTTGADVSSGLNIELNISYEGEFATDLSLWGHIANLRINEGDLTPAEVVETNYIRDGEFEYKDGAAGDPLTWTANDPDGALVYKAAWGAVNGNALFFDGVEYPTSEATYSQKFTVNNTGSYRFEYSMTCAGGESDSGAHGERFESLGLKITDASGNEVLLVGKDGLSYGPRIQERSVNLTSGVEYTLTFFAKGAANASYPFVAVDSLGIYSTEDDTQVTIDGLHSVEVGKSIVLDGNCDDITWSTASSAVTLTPSDDGHSVTVTGVSEAENIVITAEANGTTFEHIVNVTVDEPVDEPVDDSLIKDGSFEISSEADGLSSYWTESYEGPSKIQITDVSEGSNAFNVFFGTTYTETYELAQTNTFSVETSGKYELSYSAMGANMDFVAGIYEGDTLVASSTDYSAWTSTAAERYHSFVADLEAGKNYTFKFTLSNFGGDPWMTIDDITLEPYVEPIVPVEISGATTSYEDSSVTLTSNKDVTWSIDSGSEYATLSEVTGTSVKVNIASGSAGQNITVKATSSSEGEEENVATHTITVLEATDTLTINSDKNAIYDGHSITMSSNKEGVVYTVEGFDGATVEGNVITFNGGVTTKTTATVVGTLGDEKAEFTVDVYSKDIVNNGTFDYNAEIGENILNYEGWHLDESFTSNDYSMYLHDPEWNDGHTGSVTFNEQNTTGATINLKGGLYYTFTVVEESEFEYDILFENNVIWGYVYIYNEDFSQVITGPLGNAGAETSGTVKLAPGTYHYGYFLAENENGGVFNDQAWGWIKIDTMTLTAK